MNVLMISPGYPAEMPRFTRGLAQVGATTVGIGDQPLGALAPGVADNLIHYEHVGSLWDEPEVFKRIDALRARIRFDRIECLWEPGITLAAKLRERLGLPGLNHEQAVRFRDKELMKQALDRAGIRTPRHARAVTAEQVRKAASHIGYPLIIKPIAGAGATDTYRIDDQQDLESVIPALRRVEQVSVEEFVEGDEFTFDTICSGGKILYFNVCWYRPRPLEAKQKEWISPQAIAIRDVSDPKLADGLKMGRQVLDALEFRDGFTHMEWYRKADGEVVFGEIGARPPGARMVDLMNFVSDCDLYRGWADAVCWGRLQQDLTRRYNSAIIFKRAQGYGTIRRIEGLNRLRQEFGEAIRVIELLPPGTPRRDWRQHQISDGYLVVRHPDLGTTLEMADRVGRELKLIATP